VLGAGVSGSGGGFRAGLLANKASTAARAAAARVSTMQFLHPVSLLPRHLHDHNLPQSTTIFKAVHQPQIAVTEMVQCSVYHMEFDNMP
jgi:hypothetical protein